MKARPLFIAEQRVNPVPPMSILNGVVDIGGVPSRWGVPDNALTKSASAGQFRKIVLRFCIIISGWRRSCQRQGILKSKNMPRTFFSQIAGFFYARVHFKIKWLAVVPQPNRDIAFTACHERIANCTTPAKSYRNLRALDTLHPKLNRRRRSRGAKNATLSTPKFLVVEKTPR